MGKSSFFKDGGTGTNTAASIQNQLDIAAASATSAATSLAAIGTQLSDATAARVAAEAAQAASETAKNASEAARDTAITNRTAADSSASAASISETNSQTSETNSAASQSAAATSAANAATSEGNASTSASDSATSATASQTAQAASESARDASVVAKQASETARDASVVAQTASETAKTASEAARDLSLTYRNTAETHKNSAAASASAAATSENNASTSASNAATSATGASSSAASAASAQTAAEAARDSALAAFDSFDDRYLGAKVTGGGVGDPTVDNDGNSLVSGALFYDETNNVVKIYTGSAWVAAYVSGGSFAALSGATFTGDVTVPNLITAGNVDGRDVSVDGTKLDGIASGATAVSSLTDLSISDGTNGQALKTDGAGNFSFGDVATSTAFADLTGKPTTIAGYGITDAFDGAYGSLTGTPTIPTNTNQLTNGAGFITSADGGNATTLDGLDLHTGRNNEANKVVRTNSSGYADFGWINTTSGATTSTISRIYASQDAYIRYVTPATFRDQVISGQTITDIYNNGWYRSNGARGWYNQTYGGGIFMQDTTYVRTYGSKQFFVNNHIKTSHNVYAYFSDERLKTKTGDIDNALDKVQSLSGFTYVENELAKELGYNSDEEQVGVSAQQVQAVCPQAVHLAPVDEKVEDDGTIVSKSGENYITVDYPRLVPLLIEAIKELKAEVDELKAGCCHGSTD